MERISLNKKQKKGFLSRFFKKKSSNVNETSKNKIIEALFKHRATNKEKEALFENIGLMLAANVDIVVALGILKSETKSEAVKNIIATLEEDVKNGTPVWKSFSNVSLLPKNLLSIIRIGEESGQLPNNIEIVVKQIRKDREFKSKLRSASLYPSFVLIIMFIVSLGIGTFILPRLSDVYTSLNVDLPLVTKALIAIGDFLGKYGLVVIPVFILILLLIFFLVFIYSKTKIIGQTILLNAPILKHIVINTEVSRMGYLLGALLKGGFPVLESLDLLESSTSYFSYKKFYRELKENISKGYSFSQSFNSYKRIEKLLPVYARQLIISAQETGNLPKVLKNIAKTYEKKSDETTKNLEVLLEPILLIIVWIGVAFIAFAVIMPIYGLTGSITDVAFENNTDEQLEIAENPVSTPEVNTPSDDVNSNEETRETADAGDQEVSPIVQKQTLEILPTETGNLNVRDSISGNVISSVTPGTVLEYTEFDSGWYKVILEDGTIGWISGVYAKVL